MTKSANTPNDLRATAARFTAIAAFLNDVAKEMGDIGIETVAFSDGKSRALADET